MDCWIENIGYEEKKLFYTPVFIEKDNDYLIELKKRLSSLEKLFYKVSAENDYVEDIKKYKNILIEIIESYYSGDIFKAQRLMDVLLDDFYKDSIAVSNINNSISFSMVNSYKKNIQFFRARCSEKIHRFDEKEMLHIPFSKRSMVKSERFSIPGLPCLYLGTSSYVCWLELGRPADYMFNVSPVYLNNKQKILNLTINFEDFCNSCNKTEKERKIIFKLFLLSFATSFNVVEENRNFKSEYIISQLIMLGCKKKGLDGVAYLSKQLDDDNLAGCICVNLALFANYKKGQEFSDICKNIKIGKSFNFSLFKNLEASLNYINYPLSVDYSEKINIIGYFERQYKYKETKFYSFDNFIFSKFDEDYFN